MTSLREKVKEIEREEILNALKECKWIKSRAARKLGITERMIGYKIRKYKIRKEGTAVDNRRGENTYNKGI